jgi:hypothetical protein
LNYVIGPDTPDYCTHYRSVWKDNAEMEFISGYEALETIASVLKAEKDQIVLAVAFWGSDADELLALDEWQAESIQIICDATSGACNPRALRYLQAKVGRNLFTNPRLHAKVYWTPKCALITSANASANGLSLQDKEQASNIEAGVILRSPDVLKDVKRWFDETLKLHDTMVVDGPVIDEATRMWKLRRPGRRTVASSLLAALEDKAIVADRNIMVRNYKDDGRSEEGESQHVSLQDGWDKGFLKAPVSVEYAVDFTCVDDYEEVPPLKSYPWGSWVIDLTDPRPIFWFVPDKTRIIRNSETVTVPLFGAKQIPLGARQVALTKADRAELKRRWKEKIGGKNDEWISISDLAE